MHPSTPPVSTPLPSGTPQEWLPAGFVSFCLREPSQCAASPGQPEIVQIDDSLWAKLQYTNQSINLAVTPKSDNEHYGRGEYWAIVTDGFGDCEDYALTKRKQLIDAGVPQRALRIAIVNTPHGDRHAVLTVATDKGDYVLDNLRTEILPWAKTGYAWVTRQSANGTWDWVALTP